MVEYPLFPNGYLISLSIRNFSALPVYPATASRPWPRRLRQLAWARLCWRLSLIVFHISVKESFMFHAAAEASSRQQLTLLGGCRCVMIAFHAAPKCFDGRGQQPCIGRVPGSAERHAETSGGIDTREIGGEPRCRLIADGGGQAIARDGRKVSGFVGRTPGSHRETVDPGGLIGPAP